MKTPNKLGGMILAAAAFASLAACTYHERTVVERPVASTPSTVIVPESKPNTVIVPEGGTVVVPPS